MNPFEEQQDNKIFDKFLRVTIWTENSGRKKNTYCVGWHIPFEELQKHLAIMKKTRGGGGTLKKEEKQGAKETTYVLHLQGDCAKYVNDYIVGQGVDQALIKING